MPWMKNLPTTPGHYWFRRPDKYAKSGWVKGTVEIRACDIAEGWLGTLNEWSSEPIPEPTDANDLINERGTTHGDFDEQARITHQLKLVLHAQRGWNRLSPGQQEALEMVAVKTGRILAGNPNHDDHWADIAGYGELGRRTGKRPRPVTDGEDQ